MKRSSRFIKRKLALVLMLLLSIESFAAVVGDNDGAAFITKAEFDSMKNDFQSQLDRYNSSLDNKIDGAIASYLAGVRVAKQTELKLDSKCGYTFPLRMFYNNSLWNDPTSDYYDLGKPEIHGKEITFGQEMKYDDNNQDAADIQGTIIWTPDNMNTLGVGNAAPLVGTNKTIPPTTTTNLFCTYLLVKNYDIKGVVSPLCLISSKSTTRTIGTTTYDVFDLKTKGVGNQIRYLNTQINTSTKRSGWAKTDSGFCWCGYAICGASSMSPNASTKKWTIGNQVWRTDYLYINGFHGSKNNADFWAWGNGATTDITVDDMVYLSGYNTFGARLDGLGLQNNVVNWSDTNGNNCVYAGTATLHAEQEAFFGYRGSFVKNLNSNLYYAGILQTGQSYGSMFNYSASNRSYPLYQFKYILYQPDYTAELYNNSTKSAHVSAYRACQVRYFDSNGDEHFLDEGMFLAKFDAQSTAKFTLKFGTDSGTKNVRVYLSKKPFSLANGVTQAIRFKVSGETGYKNFYEVTTGRDLKIEVDNIEKGESLYLLWVPVNSGDFVTLDTFSDFIKVS